MKFGTVHQILNPVTVTWPKSEIFGIQDGGDRNLEIRFFGHYPSTDCPISAKFCMRKQNGMPNPRWWTAAILKITKSPYLSEKSPDFDKIWYTKEDIEPNDSHVTKNCNF